MTTDECWQLKRTIATKSVTTQAARYIVTDVIARYVTSGFHLSGTKTQHWFCWLGTKWFDDGNLIKPLTGKELYWFRAVKFSIPSPNRKCCLEARGFKNECTSRYVRKNTWFSTKTPWFLIAHSLIYCVESRFKPNMAKLLPMGYPEGAPTPSGLSCRACSILRVRGLCWSFFKEEATSLHRFT